MPNLDDLRGVLFEQLKRIQDPKEKFDASRTRAITDIAGRLLESARLEIDYARATKKAGVSKTFIVTLSLYAVNTKFYFLFKQQI